MIARPANKDEPLAIGRPARASQPVHLRTMSIGGYCDHPRRWSRYSSHPRAQTVNATRVPSGRESEAHPFPLAIAGPFPALSLFRRGCKAHPPDRTVMIYGDQRRPYAGGRETTLKRGICPGSILASNASFSGSMGPPLIDTFHTLLPPTPSRSDVKMMLFPSGAQTNWPRQSSFGRQTTGSSSLKRNNEEVHHTNGRFPDERHVFAVRGHHRGIKIDRVGIRRGEAPLLPCREL